MGRLLGCLPFRSLSDVQEAAQFLAGDQLPGIVISGLISKSKLESVTTLGLINLTPYDSWVEKVAKRGLNSVAFKSLSLTKNLNVAQFVEKTMALELLQDNESVQNQKNVT